VEILTRSVLLGLAAVGLSALVAARAEVIGIEVLERSSFASGVNFGEAGAYEKIRGVAKFSLDPNAAANQRIVDLKSAPRDAGGRVTFESPFILLRPVKARNSTLVYDVNNRGGIAILGQMDGASPANNDPTTVADAGDGFLMRHGFTLLFSAWTWDVAPQSPGVKPLIFAPLVAHQSDGTSITGLVENEFIVNAPTDVTVYAGMRGLTYEPATPNDPAAILTARARPSDTPVPVDRATWRFVAPEQPGGPGRVQLDEGFQPGILYELIYTAKDPNVTGAGLAGIRDLLAYFRDHPFEGAPVPRKVLIFGISQSGRIIGRMLHDGLNVDETGRLAFDGAYMQVPGAGGSGGFNSRFAQPTRHPSLLEEHDYPSDVFPFTSTNSRDPVTGAAGSILDRARDAHGHLPKLIIANTSTEFWNRDASLIATTPDGHADVAPAANVRIYGFMGAQHYVGRSRTRAPYMNCVSTTDHYLAMRALLIALDRWTNAAAAPPVSAYPSLHEGTLIRVDAYRATFPRGIGLAPPEVNLREPRLDFGPRFASEGIADHVPPVQGPPFETRVPAPDADGNDRGGVRLIELQAPLGTHTGWNQRAPDTGFPWATARFDGSFVPFARTEAERRSSDDPRPSIESRYPTRSAFVAKVRMAAKHEVAAGFLLSEDVERAVSENLALYDRIMAHAPEDQSCRYLFAN
jgi:Alpha/beta hydrolase domain